jgi:hypothetical protein
VKAKSCTSRARSSDPTSPAPESPGRERVYSDAEIDAALTKSHGILAVAARALGCARRTLHDRIEGSPDYWKPRLAAYRETMVDKGENVILQAMDSEDEKVKLDAAKYLLTCLGKARGYGTQATIDVTGLAVNILPDRTHDEE